MSFLEMEDGRRLKEELLLIPTFLTDSLDGVLELSYEEIYLKG